jgi:hypothetical protein
VWEGEIVPMLQAAAGIRPVAIFYAGPEARLESPARNRPQSEGRAQQFFERCGKSATNPQDDCDMLEP